MKNNNCKSLALEAILLSMDELKGNLQTRSDKETIETNCAGMLMLAEAYEKVANAK